MKRKPTKIDMADYEDDAPLTLEQLDWSRAGERAADASGGHIDLWNGKRLTNNGVIGTLETAMRFSLRINDRWIPIYSDLRRSKAILFWKIK